MMINDNFLLDQRQSSRGPSSVAGSVATTAFASEAGTFVGQSKDSFLRSVTFTKAQASKNGWEIKFVDGIVTKRKKTQQLIMLDEAYGLASSLRIRGGDYLYSINCKRIGPSYNAARAMELMNTCLQENQILNVTIRNNSGNDTLVEATIYKDKYNWNFSTCGMVVWKWGVLCIKSIDDGSIFKQTALKPKDHLISMNGISCHNITPESFSDMMNSSPNEINIVVRRNKQRWTGKFG